MILSFSTYFLKGHLHFCRRRFGLLNQLKRILLYDVVPLPHGNSLMNGLL